MRSSQVMSLGRGKSTNHLRGGKPKNVESDGVKEGLEDMKHSKGRRAPNCAYCRAELQRDKKGALFCLEEKCRETHERNSKRAAAAREREAADESEANALRFVELMTEDPPVPVAPPKPAAVKMAMRVSTRVNTAVETMSRIGGDVLLAGYTSLEAELIIGRVGDGRVLHFCNPPINAAQASHYAENVTLGRDCCQHEPHECNCGEFVLCIVEELPSLTVEMCVILPRRISVVYVTALDAYEHVSHSYGGEIVKVFNLDGSYSVKPGPNYVNTAIEQYNNSFFLLTGQGQHEGSHGLWKHVTRRVGGSDVFRLFISEREYPVPFSTNTLTAIASIEDMEHVGPVARASDPEDEARHTLIVAGPRSGGLAEGFDVGYSTGSCLLAGVRGARSCVVVVPKQLVCDIASRFALGPIDRKSVFVVAATVLRNKDKYALGPNGDVISKIAIVLAAERACATDSRLVNKLFGQYPWWHWRELWKLLPFRSFTRGGQLASDIKDRNDQLQDEAFHPISPKPALSIVAALVSLYLLYKRYQVARAMSLELLSKAVVGEEVLMSGVSARAREGVSRVLGKVTSSAPVAKLRDLVARLRGRPETRLIVCDPVGAVRTVPARAPRITWKIDLTARLNRIRERFFTLGAPLALLDWFLLKIGDFADSSAVNNAKLRVFAKVVLEITAAAWLAMATNKILDNYDPFVAHLAAGLFGNALGFMKPDFDALVVVFAPIVEERLKERDPLCGLTQAAIELCMQWRWLLMIRGGLADEAHRAGFKALFLAKIAFHMLTALLTKSTGTRAASVAFHMVWNTTVLVTHSMTGQEMSGVRGSASSSTMRSLAAGCPALVDKLRAIIGVLPAKLRGGALMSLVGRQWTADLKLPEICSTSKIVPSASYVEKKSERLVHYGPVVADHVPTSFSVNSENEYNALVERLLRMRPETSKQLYAKLQPAVDAILWLLADYKDYLLLGVMEFEKWVRRYPAWAQVLMRRARVELLTGQAPSESQMFRATASLKVEKGAFEPLAPGETAPSGLESTDKAPRVIVGFRPYPNVIMGPVQATMKKALQQGLAGTCLVYAPGHTGERLGSILHQFLAKCNGHTIHESDVSKMDANVNATLNRCVTRVWRHFGLHKISRYGRRATYWYDKLRRVSGLGTCGTWFSFKDRTPSGIVYTTDANTVIMMVVLLDAYADALGTTPMRIVQGYRGVPRCLFMVGGDDSFVVVGKKGVPIPASRLSESGLPFKGKAPDLVDGTFLSGRFYPCVRETPAGPRETLCLAPKIGRALFRLGWFVQPPHGVAPAALVRGTALGLAGASFVPVLGEFIDHMLRLTQGVQAVAPKYEHSLYRTVRAGLVRTVDTVAAVCETYKTTPHQCESAVAALRQGELRGSFPCQPVSPFAADVEDGAGRPITTAHYPVRRMTGWRGLLSYLFIFLLVYYCTLTSAESCGDVGEHFTGYGVLSSGLGREGPPTSFVIDTYEPLLCQQPANKHDPGPLCSDLRVRVCCGEPNEPPDHPDFMSKLKSKKQTKKTSKAKVQVKPARMIVRPALAARPAERKMLGAKNLKSATEVMAAPSSVASVMRKKNLPPVVITMREEISDLTLGPDFANSPLLINPGNADLFPWLSTVASRFTSYRFRRLRFDYVAQSDTSTSGTVALAVNADPNATPFETVKDTLNHAGSATAAPWVGFGVSGRSATSANIPKKFIADVTGVTPGSGVGGFFQDLGLIADGVLNVVTDGLRLVGAPVGTTPDPVTTGKMFSDYEVELWDPTEEPTLDSGVSAFGYGGTTNFNIEREFLPGDAINPLKIAVGTSDYKFKEAGRYLVLVSTISSGGLSLSPADFVLESSPTGNTDIELKLSSYDPTGAGAAGILYYFSSEKKAQEMKAAVPKLGPTDQYGHAVWAVVDVNVANTESSLQVTYTGPTAISTSQSLVAFAKVGVPLAAMYRRAAKGKPQSLDCPVSKGFFVTRSLDRERQAAIGLARIRNAVVSASGKVMNSSGASPGALCTDEKGAVPDGTGPTTMITSRAPTLAAAPVATAAPVAPVGYVMVRAPAKL